MLKPLPDGGAFCSLFFFFLDTRVVKPPPPSESTARLAFAIWPRLSAFVAICGSGARLIMGWWRAHAALHSSSVWTAAFIFFLLPRDLAREVARRVEHF